MFSFYYGDEMTHILICITFTTVLIPHKLLCTIMLNHMKISLLKNIFPLFSKLHPNNFSPTSKVTI